MALLLYGSGAVQSADRTVRNWFLADPGSTTESIATWVAHLGDPLTFLLLAALAVAVGLKRGRRREAIAALAVVAGANLTTQLLKVLVWLGPLLVVAFAAAGVWLVRDLVVAGLWFAGAGLLGLAAVTIGVRAVVSGATDRLTDPVAADAARAVVSTFTDSLGRNAVVVGVVLIVLLAVSAYLAVQRRGAPRATEEALA